MASTKAQTAKANNNSKQQVMSGKDAGKMCFVTELNKGIK